MATTTPFSSDANTYDLWLLDGTVGSAGKKLSNSTSRNITEVSTLTAGTGNTTPTSNGTYVVSSLGGYLQIPNANVADFPTGSYTIEMWINPTNFSANAGSGFGIPTIASIFNGASGTNRVFSLNITGAGTPQFYMRASDGTTNTLSASSNLSTSTWYYLAFVFTTGVGQEIFINGVSAGTSAFAKSGITMSGVTANLLFFGIADGGEVSQFNGSIDCVKISNTARTSTEISNYYNSAGGGGTVSSRRALLGVGA